LRRGWQFRRRLGLPDYGALPRLSYVCSQKIEDKLYAIFHGKFFEHEDFAAGGIGLNPLVSVMVLRYSWLSISIQVIVGVLLAKLSVIAVIVYALVLVMTIHGLRLLGLRFIRLSPGRLQMITHSLTRNANREQAITLSGAIIHCDFENGFVLIVPDPERPLERMVLGIAGISEPIKFCATLFAAATWSGKPAVNYISNEG